MFTIAFWDRVDGITSSIKHRVVIGQCLVSLFRVDFSEWTVEHVQLWLNWAKQHFDLSNLETEQVVMTGKDIFTFDADVIMNALGLSDPMFENHLKLLKELNMISELNSPQQRNFQLKITGHV